MRTASIMLALALAACSVPSSAADVEFEARSDLFEKTDFEKSAATELGFGRRVVLEGNETYDSPLYEGLWSMTLAAFRRLDEPKDTEFPTFCIAANN